MKGLFVLIAGLSFANAAAVNTNYKLSDLEILEAILQNSYILPKSIARTLYAKAHSVQKRQATAAPKNAAPSAGTNLLSGLLSLLSGSPPSTAPKTTVPE